TFADKRDTCLNCDFYKKVQDEEGKADRQTKFLRYITQNYMSPAFNKMEYRRIKAGDRFITQGETEYEAFIINQGSCLVIVEKDGELFPVDHYGEGDIAGGLGILTGEPRRAHVEAETDMEVWVLKKAQFDDISKKDPDILTFLTEIVADRLDSQRPTGYRTVGKYISTDIIGRGGFSIVYKGLHKGLNMPVAIKMMRHDMVMNDDFLTSFRNEAKVIANLNHENIIKVYDIEERFKTVFIIMEHVSGKSLAEMIKNLKTIPPDLTVNFLYQVCSALSYAHKQGIIHRDINPTNIIIQKNDRLKILDFGLACPIGTEDFGNTGTAFYMAPEQIEGDPVDPRTDIYALGIVAYEMVTGQRPYPEADLMNILDMHINRDIPDPGEIEPQLPEALRQFILKACQRNPDNRFENADQALEALKPLIKKAEINQNNLSFEKKKMSTFFLIYNDEHQLALNRLMDEFSARVREMGVEFKVADFHDL
ncbi:protein kinase, partial [Desulfobacterales bacterium HSG17]|nr:protein kinase [Desulfobacterales bacterium HSG17]